MVTAIWATLLSLQQTPTKDAGRFPDQESFADSLARISTSFQLRPPERELVELKEMLPEVASNVVRSSIEKALDVKECVDACSSNVIRPGIPVRVTGVLQFPQVALPDDFDPFLSFDLKISPVFFHGEECFIGRLTEAPFFLPIYFPRASFQVLYAREQLVEVMGVAKWSPWFKPGSGSPIGIAIRAGAVWIM